MKTRIPKTGDTVDDGHRVHTLHVSNLTITRTTPCDVCGKPFKWRDSSDVFGTTSADYDEYICSEQCLKNKV